MIDGSTVAVSLDAAFTSDPAGKLIIQVVLMEFLQEVNGKFYPLSNGLSNCLKIVVIDSE